MSEEVDSTDDRARALLDDEPDVARAAPDVADAIDVLRPLLPGNILEKYEVYSYRNAGVILHTSHSQEFAEILRSLGSFSLTVKQIRTAGGNESEIPKTLNASLRPLGWYETVVRGDLHVKQSWAEESTTAGRDGTIKRTSIKRSRELVRERFLDGHKIDYVKNRVAFDLEWNSKDQTFDRDLYAFDAFARCGVIDVGVLVTRAESLNDVFRAVGPALKRDGTIELKSDGTPRPTIAKYGASTTWMGKLLYRLNAGRNGSCPVLAFGIKPTCVSDWKPA